LADIVKSDGLFRRASFALHYFPAIPVQVAAEEPTSNADRDTFQRVELGRPEPRMGGGLRQGDTHAGHGAGGVQDAESRHIAEVADAYRQGFSEGERVGLAAGRSEVAAVMQRFGALLQELEECCGKLQTSAEAQVVALALAVARKVMIDEYAGRTEAVTGMVRAALRRAADRRQIRVRIHPRDLETIQQALPRFGELAGKLDRVSVAADPAVSHGCVLESEFGEIDARMDTQLALIAELFDDQLEARRGPQGAGMEGRRDDDRRA
jgi:flagellar assembly protein FliH